LAERSHTSIMASLSGCMPSAEFLSMEEAASLMILT